MSRGKHTVAKRSTSPKPESLSTIDKFAREAAAADTAVAALRPRCEKLLAVYEQLKDCRALRNVMVASDSEQTTALLAAAALYRKANIAQDWPTVFSDSDDTGFAAAELATLAVAGDSAKLRGAVAKLAGAGNLALIGLAMLDGNKAMLALFCDRHEPDAEAEGDYADRLPFYGMLRSRERMRRQRATTETANAAERATLATIPPPNPPDGYSAAGRWRVSLWEASFGGHHLHGLTKRHFEILRALVQANGDWVGLPHLIAFVDKDSPDPKPAVRTYISQIRTSFRSATGADKKANPIEQRSGEAYRLVISQK